MSEVNPFLEQISKLPGRVRVRRATGWGAAYMPEARATIPEGGVYYLPLQEAIDREDWVLDQDVSHLMAGYTVPAPNGCCS